jgi:hypothetical protein
MNSMNPIQTLEVRNPIDAFLWITMKVCSLIDSLLDGVFRHD